MATFPTTARTRGRRLRERVTHDKAEIYGILDEAFVCHAGFVDEGQPFVIPTLYGRRGDLLYIHGSAASRMLRALGGGAEVCVTVTLVDGLVLARSAFHHSVNYRSVMMFGRARLVTDPDEKLAALKVITDHVTPDRWEAVRPPSAAELKATAVVALPLEVVSAKIRRGGPVDDEADYALPVWAGVVPLHFERGEPQPDERTERTMRRISGTRH